MEKGSGRTARTALNCEVLKSNVWNGLIGPCGIPVFCSVYSWNQFMLLTLVPRGTSELMCQLLRPCCQGGFLCSHGNEVLRLNAMLQRLLYSLKWLGGTSVKCHVAKTTLFPQVVGNICHYVVLCLHPRAAVASGVFLWLHTHLLRFGEEVAELAHFTQISHIRWGIVGVSSSGGSTIKVFIWCCWGWMGADCSSW